MEKRRAVAKFSGFVGLLFSFFLSLWLHLCVLSVCFCSHVLCLNILFFLSGFFIVIIYDYLHMLYFRLGLVSLIFEIFVYS